MNLRRFETTAWQGGGTFGYLSAWGMYPDFKKFLSRDYFGRPVSSLSCSFSSQGLFLANRMHLYLPLFHHRDYFGRLDASLSGSFAPQGLFRPTGCIPVWLFCSAGIISTGRFHLYLALFLHRDYFVRPVSSLPCSFSSQGLFPPASFISILLFFSTGIISTGRFHL